MTAIDDNSPAYQTKYIRHAITQYNKTLREKHRWLRHQNAIGLSILILMIILTIISSVLYIENSIPWWLCVLLNAFFISIVHEIEHDLIHQLYFKKNKLMHNTMLSLAWLVRPSSPNPWVRRKLHLRHHQISGSKEDLEERALTNGFQWGLPRFYMMADLMLSSIKVIADIETWKGKLHASWVGFKSYVPVTALTWLLWYCFLLFHTIDGLFTLSGNPISWSDNLLTFIHYLNITTVILIAPNVLWTFCLHFVSSNMHYYGDIDSNNVTQQTQVMNSYWMWPLNMFCANFGSTHSIHHFVVNEPFYIRQMSAKTSHQAMKKMGVRFNDFGTFRRSNRWSKQDRT
ncbi:fatty acid desaturase [Serratia sp. NPDC078593]|uniref:fatty acid desaturase n=1 Tax=unclassified Serratia (in: enterobacteria) TaxID=2647522 RepID=UPI0037D929F8